MPVNSGEVGEYLEMPLGVALTLLSLSTGEVQRGPAKGTV